ncbi:MAG: cytochrome c nitrite reductase small subunit [Pirellulales bacterium]
MIHRLATNLGSLVTLGFIPRRWRLPCFLALGVAAGMGLFVVHASRAASYLSEAPETCMNCHVMATEYVTWQHGSHSRVATCNDCHVPHDSFMRHYGFKAKDGLWHSTVFTMRWEPQAIRLSARAVPVVEANCRRCHAGMICEVSLSSPAAGDPRCWDCHREVPHGVVRSLSATPGIFQPRLPSIESARQEPRIGGRAVEASGVLDHESTSASE